MLSLKSLPHLNATLNLASAILLVCGFVAIRRGREKTHIRLMLSACVVSALFLASYLTYHFSVQGVTKYQGHGWWRGAYLAILISHSVLAVVTLPLVLTTVYLGLRGRIERHRKLARWTWPIWLYVSVTGVLVYLLLYQL